MRKCSYPPAPDHQIPVITTENKTDGNRRRLGRRERLALAAVGLVLVGLLAVAVWIPPSPTGYGAHRRLGLPPCMFLTLFGRPCPTCGMTTAWAHLMKGHWLAALQANAGGALLCLLASAAAPWTLGSAIRGAWLAGPPRDVTIAWIAVVVFAVVLIQWIGRLSI
jgi:hypothetical protein